MWAYEGKDFAEWERLAELMALIRNVNRGEKDRAITGYDIWHRPGAKRPRRPGTALTTDFLHGMREAFTRRLD